MLEPSADGIWPLNGAIEARKGAQEPWMMSENPRRLDHRFAVLAATDESDQVCERAFSGRKTRSHARLVYASSVPC